MLNYILVFLGAGLGGVSRYAVSIAAFRYFPAVFPYGTLFVNIIGSFLLGLLYFNFGRHDFISAEFKLLFGVGFCGGFTTFSTFSFETLTLMREAEYIYAIGNVFLNIFLSIGAVAAAYIITKW